MAKKKLTQQVKNMHKEVRKVIRNYLNAWKKQDWEAMLKSSTKTFKAYNKSSYFADWFGKTKLISYKVIEIKTDVGVLAKCDVVIHFELMPAGKTDFETRESEIRESEIRLIQEKAAYTASVNGVWGVNPPSSLRCLNPDTKVAIPEREDE
jgi:hypothetical protein